jgi:hypothetical protein
VLLDRRLWVRLPMSSLDFSFYLILPAALCSGVNSASNRNEYQEFSWGLRAADWCVRLTTPAPSLCRFSRQNVGASTVCYRDSFTFTLNNIHVYTKGILQTVRSEHVRLHHIHESYTIFLMFIRCTGFLSLIFQPTVYHGHVPLPLLLGNERLIWSVARINANPGIKLSHLIFHLHELTVSVPLRKPYYTAVIRKNPPIPTVLTCKLSRHSLPERKSNTAAVSPLHGYV